MGLILSRFRKTNTKDQLESIEKLGLLQDIKNIHEYRICTQQRQKQFLGSLIAVSVVVYVCFATIFYLYYFPNELSQQVVYSLPLVLFPLLVWVLRELTKWFFQSRLRKNETRLTDLLRKKRKILEDVMETETYKVARELLERYDPDQFRKPGTASEDAMSTVSEPGVRRRITNPSVGFPVGTSSPNIKSQMSMPAGRSSGSTGFSQGLPSSGGSMQPGISGYRPPGPPMPRPILPRDRTFMERLIEYLVGDGPNTRFALICRQCNSHNGMALKEEFEYIAFRCCYCYYWNPARKQRPAAPRLPDHQFIQPVPSEEESDPSKVELTEVAEEQEGDSENASGNELLEEEYMEDRPEEEEEEEEKEVEIDPEEEIIYLDDDDEAVVYQYDELDATNSSESKVASEEGADPNALIIETGSEAVDLQDKDEKPKSELGEGDQAQFRLADVENN
uniref:Endoplasmic reticulum junction formation protein lunapark n=1 Tax=Strigamia maritima TaxID=126957 RepID=T1ISS4_STRMM